MGREGKEFGNFAPVSSLAWWEEVKTADGRDTHFHDLVGKGKRVELKSQLEVQWELKASLVRSDLKGKGGLGCGSEATLSICPKKLCTC